jgi:pimeloyl-ACP methyl ester carboxylesterase
MATPRPLSTAQRVVLEYYRAKLNLMHVINARWAAAAAIDLFQTPYARPRRKESAIWKKAKKLHLVSGEHKLVGYHWLPKEGGGKRLLIAHGFAGSAKSFDHYIGPALAKGYEVFAYDAPGHGKSSGKKLNLLSYKWVLEDVIRHHQGFDAYLAHSLGGMSLMLALEACDMLHQEKIAMVAPLVEAHRAAENFFRFLQLPNRLKLEFEKEIEARAGHPLVWYSLPRLVRQHRGQLLWVHDKDDDTTPFIDVKPVYENPPGHVNFLITEGLGHSRVYRDNKVRKAIMDML